MSARPPGVLRRLLAAILPAGRVRDGLMGDLDELYAERARKGRAAADLWYARQLASAVLHYRLRRQGTAEPNGEGIGMMESVGRDVAFALRALRRRPGFTAVIVLTLALGIGANTAVFSVVRSVLLRPLPYPEDDRLAVVLLKGTIFNNAEMSPSPPEYVAFRDQLRSWTELATYRIRAATITAEGADPERVSVVSATRNLFPVLGRDALVGRVFGAEEDRPEQGPVALLGHEYWRTRLGGDPGVIGRTLEFDGIARTIIGVMPPDFRFPDPDVQVWLPMTFDEQQLLGRGGRGNHSYSVVGRLRPGVPLAAAEAELNDLITRLAGDPAANFHSWHPGYLRSLRPHLVGDVSRTLWVMLGAVGLVLVIACANVANLLLVRAEERTREMSVRTALGAGRRRIVWQLLTESVVVATLGGAAGVVVAYLGVDVLRMVAPADLPRLEEIRVDAAVLLFTGLVVLLAGVVFGLAPAAFAWRNDVHGVLRDQGRGGTAGRGRVRLRQLLVVSETALAVVLLVAAGLLLQSFRRLAAVDPGFRAAGVLTARLSIPGSQYPESEDIVRFYESLLPRIRALPGVVEAGAVGNAPLITRLGPTDTEVEGWLKPSDSTRVAEIIQIVTPGYFAVMGIPLLEGRTFDARDRTDAPLVAVVSEKLARKYWPGRSALGGRIRFDWQDAPFAEVVGVVADVHQNGLDEAPVYGTYYFVQAHGDRAIGDAFRTMTLTVRASVEPASLVGAVRGEVQALDPSIPLYQVQTMEEAIAADTATERFSMLLQLVFAAVALSLSAIGLYGLLSFTVARRTAEMGIRMALGAQRADVRRMVVRQGMALVGLAVLVGLAGGLAAGRLMSGLLFGVSPTDPVTYTLVVGVLMAVALLACWLPARRASAVDPAVALRDG
jgi:putative ABC transport system permease protein